MPISDTVYHTYIEDLGTTIWVKDSYVLYQCLYSCLRKVQFVRSMGRSIRPRINNLLWYRNN